MHLVNPTFHFKRGVQEVMQVTKYLGNHYENSTFDIKITYIYDMPSQPARGCIFIIGHFLHVFERGTP